MQAARIDKHHGHCRRQNHNGVRFLLLKGASGSQSIDKDFGNAREADKKDDGKVDAVQVQPQQSQHRQRQHKFVFPFQRVDKHDDKKEGKHIRPDIGSAVHKDHKTEKKNQRRQEIFISDGKMEKDESEHCHEKRRAQQDEAVVTCFLENSINDELKQPGIVYKMPVRCNKRVFTRLENLPGVDKMPGIIEVAPKVRIKGDNGPV